MINIKKWLIKPYPFPTTIKRKLLISFSFGKFIFLFLIIFKPFGFNEIEENKFFLAFIYGLITTSVFLTNLILLPLFFKKAFNPNKWNVYKMILLAIELVLIISIINLLVSRQLINSNKEDFDYFFFLSNTILIGFFPILFYVYLIEIISNKKHKNIAKSISHELKSKKNTKNSIILIIGENKNEILKILEKDLIYISSEKNYASIFHIQNGKTQETLIRLPLIKIEQQLSKHTCIVRCHKSYIINTNHVEKIKGNARGYLLKIINFEELIPVSRSFPKELLFTLVK